VDEAVAAVRSFNRTVADRIGALTDQFLGRGRPMGESRALWEIGLEGTEVRSLRTRLGLDSGYASRVLRALERERLIGITASDQDRRVRFVRLTDRGRRERTQLDRRADAVAQGFLDPLTRNQRARLVAAMADVERLLTASAVTLEPEDASSPDAQWCIGQYFAELEARFDSGFEPARSISASAGELTPPSGLLIIARLRGKPVGCGALKLHPDAPAELKRMWVSREIRGLGVGRRLLTELEAKAAKAGVQIIRLETNRSLIEAIQLYRESGYREVERFNDEPYADHWFEKELRAALAFR
jgi:DNA-binding MarR family transcriptional regulator/GNAT superfamily N-acetyltransferase